MGPECDIQQDRAWSEQFYCASHCAWFRSSAAWPEQCPAGENYPDDHVALAALKAAAEFIEKEGA